MKPIDKTKTVAFTGYRTNKILKASSKPNILTTISAEIYSEVTNLVNQGYTTFLTGMSEGFDMMAANAVIEVKHEFPHINLIAIIPFQGQELGYSDENKKDYASIWQQAYDHVYTSLTYTSNNDYLKRNDFLLDNSSFIVCFYDGQRGGTMYTYNRAVSRGMPIVNIYTKI